ncbi:MAG TPA: class I SAM-dependent methyltransferase [Solirubrobacteraceae bacterium]|nr:class I SAM-dependent methyltransferase [Solirubrobacteraceae bacterium]
MTTAEKDFRSAVGPPERYDLMGASQFSLLCALGLREHHRLLDIGCGSLRGGRLFIAYLAPGGYTGIEPNRRLVEEGIDGNLGGRQDLIALKMPEFRYNDQFDVTGAEPFQFIVAQSIASHTGPAMTRQLLGAVKKSLATPGVAVVTFFHTAPDTAEEGWKDPGTTHYRRRTARRWIAEAGLSGVPIRWYHPAQTWWAIVHQGSPLPPRRIRWASGTMLSFRRSWKMRLAYKTATRAYCNAPIRLRTTRVGRRLAARLGVGRYRIER